MDLVQLLLVLAVLTVAVAVISAPLRRPRQPEREGDAAEIAELEAARDAKYRDIRDAELDYRTGKLSRQDWESLDRRLRSEAIEILDRLERVRGDARACRRGARGAGPAR